MPNESRVDIVPAQKLFLERQNYRCLGHYSRELRKPAFTPRPHLRRHIIQHGNSRFGRCCRGFHVEARVIDDDYKRHVTGCNSIADLLKQLPVPGNVADHFDETHHTGVVTIEKANTGRFHQWTAESGKLEVRRKPSELFCNTSRVKVARRLAGDEENFRQPAPPRLP